MTTNQQIDRLINVLYDYQVKQQIDLPSLPAYNELCQRLFADIPGINEQHYRNLLYILVSKKLVKIHADTLTDAFYKPIALSHATITWYEQFGSYFDYLDYLQEKHQPKAFDEDFDTDEVNKNPGRTKIPTWVKIVIVLAAIITVLVMAKGLGK